MILFDRIVDILVYSRNYSDYTSEFLTKISSEKGFKINFHVEKNITSHPNTAVIEIYNLSQSTISLISESAIWIEIIAGYKDNKSLLYAGAVSAVSTQKSGPNRILSIVCMTDWKLNKKIYQASYFSDNDQSLKSLLIDIIKKTEIPYNEKNIIVEGNTGTRGWGFANNVENILNNLANWYNFSWSFQDYGFLALSDNYILPVTTSVDSPLIDVFVLPPEDMRLSRGFDLTCILNGSFQVGYNVIFSSKYNVKQDFKVHKIIHMGDTHSNNWTTRLIGYKVGSLATKQITPDNYWSFPSITSS
jgi:hypothetical protein